MSDIEPTRPWFQYSLRSLLVVTTSIAILCSIGVCTDWASAVTILAGSGICFVGFGPLSIRKHPHAGFVFALTGFFVRVLGQAVVLYGLMEFAEWIVSRPALTLR